MEHAAENRAEKCMFCLHCYNVSCSHCTHDMPGHHLLKIRRYVYCSVVLAKDMLDLKIDVSRIQVLHIVTHIATSADETDYVLHQNPDRVPPGSSKAAGRSALFLKIMAKKV
ncbi:uncharacterized protein C2845_PM18G06640 [Panicum miliaceum]|uniref:Uncharacterized protein n=1 Tax=Panicum miliaceum TaxID=4540 RepID=A0A3L6PM32_PANMI|nr:uncharacterized protein C2845_PM18G06640 [Panicum miliaceum]